LRRTLVLLNLFQQASNLMHFF